MSNFFLPKSLEIQRCSRYFHLPPLSLLSLPCLRFFPFMFHILPFGFPYLPLPYFFSLLTSPSLSFPTLLYFFFYFFSVPYLPYLSFPTYPFSICPSLLYLPTFFRSLLSYLPFPTYPLSTCPFFPLFCPNLPSVPYLTILAYPFSTLPSLPSLPSIFPTFLGPSPYPLSPSRSVFFPSFTLPFPSILYLSLPYYTFPFLYPIFRFFFFLSCFLPS